ncbi:NfeD-like C-terminal domain-containing protein [uncultured Thiomicrorhabdus sp.]
MESYIPVISLWSMIAIGIVLMALEMLTTTFVLFLFGLAFILIGLVGAFYQFPSGEIQLIWTFAVGLILTLLLAKTLRQRIYAAKPLNLETMQTGESGEILLTADGDYRVSYKGTTWAIANPHAFALENGRTVIVEALENNKARIRQPENSD